MERNSDISMEDNDFQANNEYDGGGEKPSILTSNFYMGQLGEVVLTLESDRLSWKLMESISNEDNSSCLGIQFASKNDTFIKICDVFGVEFIDWGVVHESHGANPECCFGHLPEMYWFRVHGVQKSKSQTSLWAPIVYTFGHDDMQTCQIWASRIKTLVGMETNRPKNLLVFVNPRSGKRHGCRIWENVVPFFSQAKVKTKVIVTERAGHAFDAMTCITNRELNSYDGVVAVGGDGLFNEILNGILLSRHKAPYPPIPPDHDQTVNTYDDIVNLGQTVNTHRDIVDHGQTVTMAEPMASGDDESPLLSSSLDESRVANPDHGFEISFPNERFRFGLIPSGSTDAIVMCTTGARDPVTSALQIILGERIRLDIAQVVRWKTSRISKHEPRVRYTASFAGYGFYGDVITESEKYRWMGPKRYDYAGTKVFLSHRSYEAQVAYMKVDPEKTNTQPIGRRTKSLWGPPKDKCLAKCDVCTMNQTPTNNPQQDSDLVTVKGRFLSIGAAVISCRNEKAPDGLVADAHLADGFLHLVLIKDCPRALYLWHLIQLARKGGTPLDFDFVEHHKTTAFTFTSYGEESVWNVDGEVLLAHKLSAQVFRGLVNVFASGPEK